MTDNRASWKALSDYAWGSRENSYLIGKTAVGSALSTSGGKIFAGCNVEHRYRINDVHAEVNAISSMVAAGYKELSRIIVVSEEKKFTPCGSCLDWIIQFGGLDCEIAYQSGKDGEIIVFTARELMPHYPE